ncbi:hypothetical protein [Sagittula salina]|uniref:Lipoprotein n=1 Tax=Sagittula salina TaxID=2820268 RepID=A0A940MMN3_9RHOB|nr:hypothetical protein [Sagittula salina]MBP0484690.1 hypothetical protein [Sagittula salina]
MLRITAVLVIFAAPLTLTGCAELVRRSSATETERTLCDVWGEGLFLPSRKDTEETAEGLTAQIADFKAACPGHWHP